MPMTPKTAGSSRSLACTLGDAVWAPAGVAGRLGSILAVWSWSPSSSRSSRRSRRSRPVSPSASRPACATSPSAAAAAAGVAAHEVAGDRGLDDHRAERVGERVVQLGGDPPALQCRRPLRCQSPLDARVLGLCAQATIVIEGAAQSDAERPRADAEDQPEEEVRVEVGEPGQSRHGHGEATQDAGEPRVAPRPRCVAARCSGRRRRGSEATTPGSRCRSRARGVSP